MERGAEDVDLVVHLDRATGTELRRQLAEQLRTAVRDGRLVAGQRLPASRRLAAAWSVSRGTVTAALAELEGEGWLTARQGSGTWVAAGLSDARLAAPAPRSTGARPEPARAAGGGLVDLVPGHPDTAPLVDAAWRRAWRDAAGAPVRPAAPPLAGTWQLRHELAQHVRRTRGVLCGADDVVVTAGTSEALRLVADARGVAGRTAAVEDPGWPRARAVLRRAGARIAGVPVDADGLVPGALAALPADTALLCVTPSHQYPLGGVLPVERRAAVLAWAAERGAWVVEDDYDSEFRFGAAPVPALASLDGDGLTAYVGTLSKTVGPGLRLGYVVAAPPLVSALLAVRADTDSPVPEVVQDAVARYLASGGLRRHVARQRRLYAERRARLVARLDGMPGVVAVRGHQAGLHVVVLLDPSLAAGALVTRLARHAVLVADLDDYRLAPDPGCPGLVLGFGQLPPAVADRGLDVLATALADAAPAGAR